MQPTSIQLLQAVVANIEELMLPQLQGDHARSAGENARMVLNHVILRLACEGQMLADDNREKRQTLDAFAEAISSSGGDLSALSGRLRSGLERIAEQGDYRPVEALSQENFQLKQLMNDAVMGLHAGKDELGPRYESLRGGLRTQLRAQLDREASLVGPAFDRARF
jgi:hypothetical protein